MNAANAREAFRESELDAEEGADILMVKPATFYLDVLADIRNLGLPVAAYHVSVFCKESCKSVVSVNMVCKTVRNLNNALD